MLKAVRSMLVVIAVVQIVFGIAFFMQWPLAVRAWPFEGTTPLTFIFISSIFAAAAGSTLWAVISKNTGALAGIGLDYILVLSALSILSFSLGYTAFGAASAAGVIGGVALFVWSARLPLDLSTPTPRPVRWAFIFFIFALWLIGGRLALRVPDTIPWGITPELSVVMGWMFLGASAYFLYGLIRPGWANAAGQLVGFLVYDLVLVVPFVTRLSTVSPQHKLGLYVYTGVVIFSGLLAVFYLFIRPPKGVAA